jgi:hypothetical protein
MTEVRSGETEAPGTASSGVTKNPSFNHNGPIIPAPDAQLFCPECGYNLQGIEGAARCPECGLVIDRDGFARSRVPWVHRRHVGRIRAYWRTVWLATARPKELAAEAARPVGYGDAQRFRLVTAAVAALPFIAGLVGTMVWYGSAGFLSVIQPAYVGAAILGGQSVPLFDVLVPWVSGATLPPVLPAAVLLAAVFVTGVAGYWFHPKHLPVVRQNRAVALSGYACAPLAFAAVPASLFTAASLLRAAGLDNQANATWTVVRLLDIGSAVTTLLLLAALWRSTMSLLSRTTHPGPGRLFLAAVLIPLKWLFLTAATLFAVPWVVGYVRLVVTSLW